MTPMAPTNVCGYSLNRHAPDMTSTQLNTFRQQADPPADQLVADCLARQTQRKLFDALAMPWAETQQLPAGDAVAAFLRTPRRPMARHDAGALASGQQVFERYASQIMMLLGGLSLPYCYAGSPGNKALYLSDKMRHLPGKRLADTSAFVLAVCRPGAFIASAEARVQVNKTRLVHAVARYFLRLQKQWNDGWGAPINQEDMAGTNLAFSYIVLCGLARIGVQLSTADREAFLFMWQHIGYELGIDERLLASNWREAQYLERLIRQRHFKASAEGRALTRELIAYYQRVAPRSQARLVEAQMRYWLGREVSDWLGLRAYAVLDGIVQLNSAWAETKNIFVAQRSTLQHVEQQQRTLERASVNG